MKKNKLFELKRVREESEVHNREKNIIVVLLMICIFLNFKAGYAQIATKEGGSATVVSNQGILKDSSPTGMAYFNILSTEEAAGIYEVDSIAVDIPSSSNLNSYDIEYFRVYRDSDSSNTLTSSDGSAVATSTRFPGTSYTFDDPLFSWTINTDATRGLIVSVETSDTITDITLEGDTGEASFSVRATATIREISTGTSIDTVTGTSGTVTAECEAIDYTPEATYYSTLPVFDFTVPEENARLRPDAQTTTLERQTITKEKSQVLAMEAYTAVLGIDIAGVNETLSNVIVHFSRPRGRQIFDYGELDQTFDGANSFDPAGDVDFNLDGTNDGESGFDSVAIYEDTDNDGVFTYGTDTDVTNSVTSLSENINDDTWSLMITVTGGALEENYDNQPDYFIVIRADSGYWDGDNQDGSSIKFGASFNAWIDNSDVNFGAFSGVTPNPSEPNTLEDIIVDADGTTGTSLPSTGSYDTKYPDLSTFTGVGITDDVYYVDDDSSGSYTYGDDLFYDNSTSIGDEGRYNAETDIIILVERGPGADADDISIADDAMGNSMPTSAITHTAGGQTYILAYYDANGNGDYDLGEDIIRDDGASIVIPGSAFYWNPERGLGLTSQAVDHVIDADGGRNPSSRSDTNSFDSDAFYSDDPKYPPLSSFVVGTDKIYYINRDNGGSYSVKEVIFLDNNSNGTYESANDNILVNVDSDAVADGTAGTAVDGTRLRYYDANRDGNWDNGEDIIYNNTLDDIFTFSGAFYQAAVKIVNAVYEAHDMTGKRIDATSSIIPVIGINAADTDDATVTAVVDPKIQSIRVDFEPAPGFEPSQSNDDPDDVDGDSDLAPLSDDMTSGVSLWKDNKSAGNIGVMDPVIDLIIDADGGSKTNPVVWGAGTPSSDDSKSEGDTLTQFDAGDNLFFVDVDDDGHFSVGDGLFLDDGDNMYNASSDTLILRWKGDFLGFADGDGTATTSAGTDNYPNIGKLESFDTSDNVYWADMDGSGDWTQLAGQRDGLWRSGGTEDSVYDTTQGDTAIIVGDMVSGTTGTTGSTYELTADYLFVYDDDEITNNSTYDSGEDIHFAREFDADSELYLRYNDENGDGNYDNGEDIIYDGDADGQWDDSHDTFIKIKSPLQWTWDSEKSIWYVIVEPDEPLEIPPDDNYADGSGENRGDDYFICIRTDDDITYEDKIRVTIPNYPTPGGTGIDNDDQFNAREGIQFTTAGFASENVDGSEFSTHALSAHLPVFLQDLTYGGQEINKSSTDVPIIGINLFNDSGRTVTLDGILIELYNQGEYGSETDKFNPDVDLYDLDVAHDGIDNDGDGWTDDYSAGWDTDLTETRMAGVVVYQDTNGNGVFDGYNSNDPASGDKPIRLYQAPTFVGDPGEPIQMALYFHNDFVSNLAAPADRNTQVYTTKDSKTDYFIVLRTSADIDNSDDFSIGIVGWGPLGETWADDSAFIFSEGINSVFPYWAPPGGYLESRSYEKIETQTVIADTIAPALPTGFSVNSGLTINGLSWTNPSTSDFAGTMIRYIENPSPVETYPVQNLDETFTGTQIFGGTFGGDEAEGQTIITLSESDTIGKLSDWFSAGDTLRLGPNRRGKYETVTISSVGTDNGTTTVTLSSGTTYAYENGDPFTTAETSVTQTGLTNGTRYNYALFAYDDVPGRQNYSLGVTGFATPASDTSAPTSISNFVAVGGDNEVTLTWDDPSSSDLYRILIVRDTAIPTGTSPSNGTIYGDDITSPFTAGLNSYWTINITEGTETYVDATATNGNTYYYRAYAYDLTYNYSSGVNSNAVTPGTTAGDTTAPGAVTDFTATGGDAQVSLSWTNPSDSDYQGTFIVRKTSGYPASISDGTIVRNDQGSSFAGTTRTWADDYSITNGTTYYYTAFAYDEVPNYSSAVSTAQGYATPAASATDGGGDGGGGGGGCFIATAAYGTPVCNEVVRLCAFRDSYLMTNLPGKLFVKTYYKISPPVARFISKHESLKGFVRTTLNSLFIPMK